MITQMKNHSRCNEQRLLVAAVALLLLLSCAACGRRSSTPLAEPLFYKTDLTRFAAIDMSDYDAWEEAKAQAAERGAQPESLFVDVTVADAQKLLEEKATFVWFASFSECPWCNAVLPYLTQAAAENSCRIGVLDTRKDPAWKNNTEIDDYDLFLELCGEYLDTDEEDKPHLYVPHVFFIRNGEVVYQHQGALPEMGDDPHMALSEEQKEALTDIFREGFRQIR